ncbi:LysM peptidoglycan-binding domain-containing protein [Actinoplanes sp. CA-252034]|uniref:LysM peptidoglycan-binding domain-containing protein n=1 Tax=Actinoplanes sp. CA-252034 TaxID=3239906 RepID=UPI003D993725
MNWLGRSARAALRYAMTGLTAAAAVAVLATGPALADPIPAPSDKGQSAPYYVVTQSYNGEPEFLYEIAERFLGDGNRAMEIFELNKGRWQPGDQQVTKPEVIEPEWVLRLPPDAKGDGVKTGPLPFFEAGGAASAAPPAAPSAAATTQATPTTAAQAPASDSGNGWLAPVLIGLAALLALGGLVWLVLFLVKRQRAKKPAPVALAVMNDSDAWAVDRAARALATACAQQGRAVPDTIAVVLGPEAVTIRLATPDEAAPAGWVVSDAGRVWSSTVGEVQRAVVDNSLPAPFAQLVPIGLTGTGQVLLNLAQSGGVISLDGDTDRVGELARAWSVRLARSPWASGVKVVRVGFELDPAERFTGVEAQSVADVARIAETNPGGGVLFLATPPRGHDLVTVNGLLDAPGRLWSAVVVKADEAVWRVSIDAAGTVQTGLLPQRTSLRV